MGGKHSDSTLFDKAVYAELARKWETYSLQGWIRPMYRISTWEGGKRTRQHRTSNFMENILVRDDL